ncbi:YbdD/YjiX family protein [Methylomonas sp. EFPC3]|uniref:YbdD/YjiX family protein n=1 Tax=Methylomonas sp. EFPC3 TaxID=3021710 RepID=UPI0024175D67|nr:YbdD/YjiX family protein [Methylomonas sp. EFPC3]WFP51244.1 YbdD/YjiX family protein [Methylomonas sp. EFPC3]
MKFDAQAWLQVWRTLNGDAAYQRYLRHWQAEHAGQQAEPLSRKAFFAAETRRKWSGVKRCC